MLAWPHGSPLVPRHAGHPTGDRTWAWLFLVFLSAAFAAYVVGVVLMRASRPRLSAVAAIACALQLAPLAAPLLLSTDAWTYWDYGRLAAVHGANPYRAQPEAFPADPAFRFVGAAWRDSTSVYGPAFTLASEPLARAAGSSPTRPRGSTKRSQPLRYWRRQRSRHACLGVLPSLLRSSAGIRS